MDEETKQTIENFNKIAHLVNLIQEELEKQNKEKVEITITTTGWTILTIKEKK